MFSGDYKISFFSYLIAVKPLFKCVVLGFAGLQPFTKVSEFKYHIIYRFLSVFVSIQINNINFITDSVSSMCELQHLDSILFVDAAKGERTGAWCSHISHQDWASFSTRPLVKTLMEGLHRGHLEDKGIFPLIPL